MHRMDKWLFRSGVGLVAALVTLMMTSAFAAAQGPGADPTPAPSFGGVPCVTCHAEVANAWEAGAHSHATSDPNFQNQWQAQGKPRECLTCHTTGYDPTTDTWQSEGVTCEVCHSPVPANHPVDPMPTDRSANLCGQCHTETLFEWQVSKHRQTSLACAGCHDPHSTQLKAADSFALCATCHKDLASNFAHTAHSAQGLTCADCHLGPLSAQGSQGHAVRDHTFQVRLTTCNACHAYQMHDPSSVHTDQLTPTPAPPDAMSSVETLSVSPQPSPVSPVGFATLSALVGLASGMVLAPWLERWYRRIRSDDDDDQDETKA
jgi:predicted CXXCH cytochrome family protein